MTERLADISARIEGIAQLGAVVNAMKGIAAARARQARTQVGSVDSYSHTIAQGLATAIGSETDVPQQPSDAHTGARGLLVFCAEQGFAGAFSERVLDWVGDALNSDSLFLVGTRGLSVAATREIRPIWSTTLPSHTPSIPKLADEITNAIYQRVALNEINRVDVIFTDWEFGRPKIVQQALFPLDLSGLPPPLSELPITQIAGEELISSLGRDFFHALVCKAALHAFAAENEARMEAMTAAGRQITRELEAFQDTLRRVRQEAITAEIIELGTGVTAEGSGQ